MATVGLGISWDGQSAEEERGVRAYYGDSHSNLYIKWHSDTGLDWVDHYDISVYYNYVPKGSTWSGGSSYGSWSEGTWSGIEAADCNPRTIAGKSYTYWSYPIGEIGQNPSGKYIKDSVAPNGWGYDVRKYDAVTFKVTVNAYYKSGLKDQYGNTNSRVQLDLALVYLPRYTLTGAAVDRNELVISYSAPGWTRLDDRYAVESISQGGSELTPGNGTVIFGEISDRGKIHIPISQLRSVPREMSTDIVVRWQSGFRGDGTDNNYMRGTTMLQNDGVCNTPVLTLVSADMNKIVVKVTDSGDKGVPFDYAQVYIVGDDYAGSELTCEPGGEVAIPSPPLGVYIDVEAIGYTDSAVSEPGTLTVDPVGGEVGEVDYITITALDGSVGVTMRFNVSVSWSFEPVMSSQKFSGRKRESVAFGVGGSVTGTVKCDILDDDMYGDLYQSRLDFERLPFAGICLLRGPDGERRNVAVESVGESWDRVRFVKQMTVSVKEVG